jgi:hypothetical protein
MLDEPQDSQDPPANDWYVIDEVSGTWVTNPNTGREGTNDYSWRCSASGLCWIGDLWISNIDFSYYFSTTNLTSDVRIYVRVIDTDTYYRATLDCTTNVVTFDYYDGSGTTIGTWDLPFTIKTDIYYEFRVVAQGSKFEVYIGGYLIGTRVHEKIVSGKVGFVGTRSTGTIDFDDITLKSPKSIALYTPVGAYDLDELRMADTDRLNDDTFSDGESVMIIDPDDPVEFRQTGSVIGGGEVKVFDDMQSASESDWIRVYALDHNFVGDLVISNGLIRLAYGSDTTQIKLSVYSNSSWEELTFLPDWSSLTIENISYGITKLERYYVTFREASYYQSTTGFDMVWTDYTIRTGSPMIHIENRRAL